jgi:hypothetical protein
MSLMKVSSRKQFENVFSKNEAFMRFSTRAVFHGGSKGSSKLLLGPAILYHSLPFGWPVTGQHNGLPGADRPQGACTDLSQSAPGHPMKYGHVFSNLNKTIIVHFLKETTRGFAKLWSGRPPFFSVKIWTVGQADHNNK